MKRIATTAVEALAEGVALVVRRGPGSYPAEANVMHTQPVFERPA